jgi:hypothetical protein
MNVRRVLKEARAIIEDARQLREEIRQGQGTAKMQSSEVPPRLRRDRRRRRPKRIASPVPEWLVGVDGNGRHYLCHTAPPVCFVQVLPEPIPGTIRLDSGHGLGEFLFVGDPPRLGGLRRVLREGAEYLESVRIPSLRPVKGWPSRIGAILEKGGLKEKDLRALLGCRHSTIWRWRRGLFRPGPRYRRMLEDLEEVYGCRNGKSTTDGCSGKSFASADGNGVT